MNLQSRQRQKKVEAETSTIFLPEEVIAEVFSYLPVKSLTRFKCASKSFNTLISDRKFIKLHLNRFSQKADCTVVSRNIDYWNGNSVTFTSIHMHENPPNNITNVLKYPYHKLDDKVKDCSFIVGSCNGLLCLCGCSFVDGYIEWWFRFWNPATRTISEKLGYCHKRPDSLRPLFNFTLGYDKSKDTFKLVSFFPKTTNIKILSLSDNVWRNIQNSPVAYHNYETGVVQLSGSVNWLAICNYFDNYDCKDIAIEQFVIISLDLDTETHTKMLPPQGFNEVPFVVPNLSLLKDCLCFSHDFKQTHFVTWQMKLFGVEESWTQLLKVSYHNLQKDYHFNDSSDFHVLPVFLSEKNDTLLLTNNFKSQAILYNRRDNRTEWINRLRWFNRMDYVESLVSYC
jgi:F-box interacting protein